MDGGIGRPLEVTCDESGFEGENLVGGNTDVFAHASIQLDADVAADCIREVRDRVRSPATEYKANHLLRQKHRSVLTWLLGPRGPIHGHAHVHLTDKVCFVLGRVLDLLVGELTYAAGTSLRPDERTRAFARTLYRDGGRTFGERPWREFLEASNYLTRIRDPWDVRPPVDSFYRALEALRTADPNGPVGDILEMLWQARPRASSFRAQLQEDPKLFPALDPLLPAIVQAVVYWGNGSRQVSIVHDEQSALTADRIAQLEQVLGNGSGARLAGVRFIDSQSDPRVQLADFLAGVARKIASDELNNRGDAELTGLLRPYVDAFSIWADERSWSLLGSAVS